MYRPQTAPRKREEHTVEKLNHRCQLFRTDAASDCFYFWVVVVWQEGRTGQMISWKFVVLEDGGQDMRFSFK